MPLPLPADYAPFAFSSLIIDISLLLPLFFADIFTFLSLITFLLQYFAAITFRH